MCILFQEMCTASLHEARAEGLLHVPDSGAPLITPVMSIFLDIAHGLGVISYHSYH